MSATHQPPAEPGLSRRLVECVTALLLCAIAALVLWDSYDRGAGWDGGPQNGFFPARVGWLLLVAALFALVSVLRRPPEVFASWKQLRQVSCVFVPLVLYIVAIAFLGIYVASALFIALFMLTVGAFRWWSVALATVLVPLLIFWVFERQFLVPLPKGPLEAALGY